MFNRFFKPTVIEANPSIFVRQPLTQTDLKEQENIQTFMDWLAAKPVHLPLGNKAMSDADFREAFEQKGMSFTPENFRNYRLNLIKNEVDGYIFYYGKALSVSGGFEVGYIYSARPDMPLLFVEADPIKTTLIRELSHAFYCNPNNPDELESTFNQFMKAANCYRLKRLSQPSEDLQTSPRLVG